MNESARKVNQGTKTLQVEFTFLAKGIIQKSEVKFEVRKTIKCADADMANLVFDASGSVLSGRRFDAR